MHGGVPEGKQNSLKTSDDTFEEIMRSAFWRGVEVLSEPKSNSIQGREQPIAAETPLESTSEHTGGICGVPKNVAQLKPVIDKLIRKDLPKGADEQWHVNAKQNIEWVQKQVSREEGFLESFLNMLDEMAPENAQEERDEV